MPEEQWDRNTTIETFMDDPSEVHAFWLGMCVAFQNRDPEDIPDTWPEENLAEIQAEHTYYLGGYYCIQTARTLYHKLYINRIIQIGILALAGYYGITSLDFF